MARRDYTQDKGKLGIASDMNWRRFHCLPFCRGHQEFPWRILQTRRRRKETFCLRPTIG